MIKGIIFDLDGTLIDSMGIWHTIDVAFLNECGVNDIPEDISDIVKKMSVDESSRYFIDRFDLDMTVEQVIIRIEELVREQYEKHIPLKEGVRELLDILDKCGIPYGVATATYKSLAEAILKRCEIADGFEFILTDSEYPAGKRSPDIFLGAAERFGFKPSEILVAEDSLHCIETSVKAGFFTVGVYDEVSEGDKEAIIGIAQGYVDDIRKIAEYI